MLVDATLLIQDVQLLCFTIVFGVLALQRWNDPTLRWLWYSFLANAAGAVLDLLAGHLPAWVSHGLDSAMIPLSYALLNVSLVCFQRRSRKAVWISFAILALALPIFLLCSGQPSQFRNSALGDLAIALESVVTVAVLSRGSERSTLPPRILMSGFLVFFVLVELARVYVAFLLNSDPDRFSPRLEMTCAVTYIINVSLLPLAFIWMMNARLEAELVRESIVDPLTDVLNRRGLDQALVRELARHVRYGDELTVAMVDLDHFKKLNDSFGHVAGDAVLAEVARILSGRLRVTDVVSRFGGEEFVLLLPHTDAEQASVILQQLCQAVGEQSYARPSAALRVTASFGATTTRGRGSIESSRLLHEADFALYRAKQSGRNQVCFFTRADEAAGPFPSSAALHPSIG